MLYFQLQDSKNMFMQSLIHIPNEEIIMQPKRNYEKHKWLVPLLCHSSRDIYNTSCVVFQVQRNIVFSKLKSKKKKKKQWLPNICQDHFTIPSKVCSRYFIIYQLELQFTENWRRLVKGVSANAQLHSSNTAMCGRGERDLMNSCITDLIIGSEPTHIYIYFLWS